MIKKYYGVNEKEEYYVGATEDIKAMYKSIARNESSGIIPLFCENAKFSISRQVYALCISDSGFVYVVDSDTMLSLILSGDVVQ